MAPGAPRGKRKPVRGGGKNFSRNLRPLDDEDDFETPRDPKLEIASSSEEDEDSSEDEGEEQQMTREEKKAAAKARKEAARQKTAVASNSDSGSEDDEDEAAPIAPRKPVKGAGGISTSNPNDPGNASGGGLTRREREALEAAAAKERYWKLQEAGKTDQAKADLARLAIIKQEREEKAKQRQAEMEERKAAAEIKAAQRGGKKR